MGEAEHSPRRKAVILAACCLGVLIAAMDGTIVNVAIPSIRDDLGASAASMQWVIAAYALTMAAVLLLSGAAGDRYGRKRVFLTGLTTFALGSLMCSLAGSVGVLVGSRAIQAVGASMLNTIAMAIVVQVFPGRVERARAIGIWGSVIGLGLALGPVLGGTLTDLVSWRAVFWINIPICLAAIVLTIVFVPESMSRRPTGFDPAGQLLGAATIFGVVFVLIEAPGRGVTSGAVVGVATMALGAAIAFLTVEARHRTPFIDLRLFRRPLFCSAIGIAVCSFALYGGFLFVMSHYLQDERGLSAIRAGLCFLPMAAAAALGSPVAGHLIGRWGTRTPLLVSGFAFTGAAASLMLLEPDTPMWSLALSFAVFGIGFGMVNAPVTALAVTALPADRSGTAAALATTSRQVGLAIGVALCGPLAGDALTHTAEFATATHPLWAVFVLLGLTIVVLALLPSRAGLERGGAELPVATTR